MRQLLKKSKEETEAEREKLALKKDEFLQSGLK
jgi:hypothetical protein